MSEEEEEKDMILFHQPASVFTQPDPAGLSHNRKVGLPHSTAIQRNRINATPPTIHTKFNSRHEAVRSISWRACEPLYTGSA